MKTQFRKQLNKDIASKLLLKDASVWQIVKHLYHRFDTEVWAALFWVTIALSVWNKLG